MALFIAALILALCGVRYRDDVMTHLVCQALSAMLNAVGATYLALQFWR